MQIYIWVDINNIKKRLKNKLIYVRGVTIHKITFKRFILILVKLYLPVRDVYTPY